GVEVVAIVSRSLEKAKEFANKYDIPNYYTSVEECLKNKEIEVIHNCTPNSEHFPINKLVIESGKHILSEKPLGLSSKETSELVQLAKTNDCLHAVCFNYRHYPLIQEAKYQLENGEHGNVHLVFG